VRKNLVGLKYLGVTLEKDPDAYISRKQVRCETLASLLDRHGVSRIDLVHVDAEGHDHRIIRQIDFERFSPRLILYEHGGDAADVSADLLARKGYTLIDCGDRMAVRRSRIGAR
jgi:hypothetical protein